MKKLRAPKTKISTNKQPSTTQLDNAFKLVALASLQQHNKSTDFGNVDRESLRIERCVEFYYVSENHDLSFGEFAANFLKTNLKDLVARTKFTEDYLQDTQDVLGESYDNTEYSINMGAL